MKISLVLSAIAPVALAFSFFSASALAAGGESAAVAPVAERAQVCAGCHGVDGKTPIDPSYPLLAGQHADYLEVSLRAYRSGSRKNAIMAGIAASLSNRDIRDLSAYYEALPGPLGYGR
ncbi:MAG: cytochrome c [Burkholderiaceae bacterium]